MYAMAIVYSYYISNSAQEKVNSKNLVADFVNCVQLIFKPGSIGIFVRISNVIWYIIRRAYILQYRILALPSKRHAEHVVCYRVTAAGLLTNYLYNLVVISNLSEHLKLLLFAQTGVPALIQDQTFHDDVIKWKHFRVTAICAWNSPVTGEFASERPVMSSLICAWINGWVNNYEAGNLRRHHAHYGPHKGPVMLHFPVSRVSSPIVYANTVT